MKTCPYLVILFLKILAFSSLIGFVDGQVFRSRNSLGVRNSRTNIRNDLKKREVFFVNLEDGFFGCQVNASVDILQLFEISKLCDGTPNCYLGSDESNPQLKCTSEYYGLKMSSFSSKEVFFCECFHEKSAIFMPSHP